MTLSDCPDDETLAQFVGRTLPEGQRAEIEVHCEDCPSCRKLVAHLVETFAESHEGPPEPARELPSPGTMLGRYVILEWVGAGAMGAVYSAYDPELDRRVALKILPPGPSDPAQRLRKRFLGEARAMASISDPNVIAVHDVGTHDGLAFFAMELVDGGTLEEWLAAESRTTDAILSVFAAAGRGLAAAHEVGLVHRDFKPHNVLVGKDGRVRVIDFGLVRFAADSGDGEAVSSDDWDRARTRTGALVGTPAYMAPEQLTASHSDASTDQFAFCVSLFEALFGARPFDGSTASALVESIEAGSLRFPVERRRVSARLRRLLARGLGAHADDRYASMAELLDALSYRASARWGLLGAGVLVIIGCGFAVYVLSSADTGPRCQPNTEQLAGIWDVGQREALLETASSETQPGATPPASVRWLADRFENYRARWLELHHQVCVATVERREQSAAVMDAKMACLGRAREQLRANVEQAIGAGGSVVARVSALAEGLPDLATCDDGTALSGGPLPPPPELAEAVDAQRRKFADSRARSAAGDYAGGVALAREIEAASKAIDYPPLRYEAALLLGRAAGLIDDEATAASSLDRALRASLSARDWPIALQAATSRACLSAMALGQPEVALAYGHTALGLAEDPSAERAWVAQTHKCMGRARLAAGAFDKAEEHHRQAVSVLEQSGEFDEIALARARAELGRTLVEREQVADGLVELRRATKLLGDRLGVEHPQSLIVRAAMVSALVDAGEYDTAEAEYLRVIELLSRGASPDFTNIGVIHAKRGNMFYGRDLYDEATAAFETAKATLTKAEGAEHPRTLSIDVSLANVLFAQGRLEEARTAYRAVIGKLEKVLPGGHPLFFQLAVSLANVELGLGNAPAAARTLLEMTSKCTDQSTLPPSECGQAQFALARALLDQGDRDGARGALAEGKRWFARSGRAKDDLEEVVSALERDLETTGAGSSVGVSGSQ